MLNSVPRSTTSTAALVTRKPIGLVRHVRLQRSAGKLRLPRRVQVEERRADEREQRARIEGEFGNARLEFETPAACEFIAGRGRDPIHLQSFEPESLATDSGWSSAFDRLAGLKTTLEIRSPSATAAAAASGAAQRRQLKTWMTFAGSGRSLCISPAYSKRLADIAIERT